MSGKVIEVPQPRKLVSKPPRWNNDGRVHCRAPFKEIVQEDDTLDGVPVLSKKVKKVKTKSSKSIRPI